MSRYRGVPCFWLEPADKVRLSLRRFTFGVTPGDEPEPGHRNCAAKERGGCNASIMLDGERPLHFKQTEHGKVLPEVPKSWRPARRDPRWPKVCESCGEPFQSDDEWQVNQLEVYIRGDTGERVAFRGYADKSMAGALYDGWWLHPPEGGGYTPYNAKPGPDGIALVAICPNGTAWVVDGEAFGGGHWTRTGDPRNPETLTVSPSIVAGDYHGFLQAGRFTDDLGS